jgi:hypothetical protein
VWDNVTKWQEESCYDSSWLLSGECVRFALSTSSAIDAGGGEAEVVAVLLPVDDDEQELLSRSDRVRVNGIVALTVLESAGETTSLPPLRTRANCCVP